MSGPDTYGAAAGHHPAPDQSYQPYQGPPGSNDPHNAYGSPPPQHAAYDPHSGHPIPPGYVPPSRPPPSSSEYFPPPPRQEYNEDHWEGAPRPEYDRAPRGDDGRARDGYEERPYAPSEAYGHEGNQITPFDEERYDAERRRGDEERRRYNDQYPPPPPSDYGRRGHYDERDRRDYDRYDRRRDDRDRYTHSDELSSYDSRDRRYERERERERENRRRDSRNSPTKTGKDVFGSREGQRGLSAQILGGAVGGLAGHEAGGSILETLGGVVVGAMGAKVLENQYEKRKSKKEDAMKNAAPFKDDAVRDRRNSYPSRPVREDRNFRDDDRDRVCSRTRSRSRRGSMRRRNSDDYSDYTPSPPPPRRRS